jgi:hypothetical protein
MPWRSWFQLVFGPTESERWNGFDARRSEYRFNLPSAVLVAAEFASNVLNPSADFFDGCLYFIFGHVEPFGPVTQLIVLMDIDVR